MKTLIGMTDFVLEQNKAEEVTRQTYIECRNYANFIKQPLTLGIFVPCDEHGNVLEKPTIQKGYWMSEKEAYQQAKERCLFEGFEVVIKDFNKTPYKFVQNKDTYVYFYDEITNKWTKVNDYNIIEDLVLYNLQLTQTAIKQLSL